MFGRVTRWPFIALELGRFTVVKGNEIASSAPRVGVKPQIHTFHKSDVLLWGLSGRFLVTVSGIEIFYRMLAYPCKATI